jgi:hypothetical protein
MVVKRLEHFFFPDAALETYPTCQISLPETTAMSGRQGKDFDLLQCRGLRSRFQVPLSPERQHFHLSKERQGACAH